MKKTIKLINTFTYIFLGLSILASCVSVEEQGRELTSISTENTADGDTDSTDTISDNIAKLPQATNFLQLGSVTTTTTLNIFSNYNDSFLIRGNSLISFLQNNTLSSQSNFCLITKFNGANGIGAKPVLITSARIRSYYNSQINAKEYFLQVEPNNKSINQSECLTTSLVDKVTQDYSGTNFTFELSEVCPDCNNNLSSTSLKLYTPGGENKIESDISFLNLNRIPNIGSSTPSSPVCTTNSSCTSINFNCCLAGQCVNHGEVRNEVDQTSDKYLVAIEILKIRPELLKDYENIFYVCPEMVPSDGGSDSDNDDSNDPTQGAADLFTELQDLYNCTTSLVDEFAICTKRYNEASSLMEISPYNFGAARDDITFTNIVPSAVANNIVEINYAGETLFKQKLMPTDSEVSALSGVTLGASNDSLSSFQSASIQRIKPPNASNDTMSIKYKVDGTCEKLGVSLARCKKFYNQGQISNPPRSSDHATGNQQFQLPSYADTSFSVIVEISDSIVPEGLDTWSLSGKSVLFNAASFPIYDNQKVTITYFASSNISQLTESKSLAQAQIDSHCKCDPNKDACTLSPVLTEVAGEDKVTSYECVYPTPDVPDAPLQETVFVSAKSVPHKFYDVNGVNYNLGDDSSIDPQEGTQFEYTDGSYLKPNNMDSHIGFNEIYGSMNIDQASPVPPKMVSVQKGLSYDIFVDEGSFSTCLNCGVDYYSSLQRVFPTNFEFKGGGYSPDLVESRRRTNQGDYRADDLKFGRSCFVPASMIPWTHVTNSDVSTQRRNRLAAQHFLFSNGLNKDWYGFDYGSLIGSFDGIKWFSIGNQRRIKATSERLYIAVNAYFGDLTINNTFKVSVSEMNPLINSGSLITHDSDSDGAECQRAHFCSTDNDCIAQMGYEYTCQNVSGIKTPWPQFDNKGNEISGSVNVSLLSILGGSNGQTKRCVYRGPGAICEQNNFNVNANNSYAESNSVALHSCSPNSLCSNLTESEFNSKITRFAESPAGQNIQTFITEKTDTFGLGARNLGRPYRYYGNEAVNGTIRTQLSKTNGRAICIPGKDISNSTTTEQLNQTNTATRQADKVANVGRTIASTILQNTNYLAACPATDDEGSFTHFKDVPLSSVEHNPFAITNNITSNTLLLNSLASQNLFSDNNSQVTTMGYQKNTCLRAPGAKCFSDFECAPNSYISSKFKSISNFNGEISLAEEKFWEEELICGNSQARYQTNSIYPNPLYETYENHCCRETAKSFTYYSQAHEGSDFLVANASGDPLIPGVNQNYNDPARYSRTHTVYDKLISEPTRYPATIVPASRPTTPLAIDLDSIRQYNTLHLHNERMCCTGNWVRKFATGSNANNGGHKFTAQTQQNLNLDTFKPLSWTPDNTTPGPDPFPTLLPYTCTMEDYVTTYCEVKNIIEGSTVEKKYLDWFGKFELVGIPQVLIETNTHVEKPLDEDQLDISGSNLPLDNTIKDVNAGGVIDATYDGKQFYSAASYDNLELGTGKLKKVFSENEFECCLPTGYEVDPATPANSCCTGTINASDGVARCCLEDFTDLSVYTNRYVSSEGATFNGQEIQDSDIDPTTGYIKKEKVIKMASTMCCSGRAVYGSIINQLHIPIDYDNKTGQCSKTRRWAYLETLDDDVEAGGIVSRVKAGLKWNNHVYCVPADYEEPVDTCN